MEYIICIFIRETNIKLEKRRIIFLNGVTSALYKRFVVVEGELIGEFGYHN